MSPRIFAMLGIAFAVAACGPDFERLDISAVNNAPSPNTGQISYQRIVVAEGTIATARIEPFNDNNKSMHLDARSSNPSRLEVANAINDRVFAFIGQQTGPVQVEFYADDELVLIVDAEVVAQK